MATLDHRDVNQGKYRHQMLQQVRFARMNRETENNNKPIADRSNV